jgi:hypothetical protein
MTQETVLTPDEISDAYDIADARLKACLQREADHGAVDKKVNDGAKLDTHFTGVAAELAFAKIYGLDNAQVRDTSTFDAGYDFLVQGKKVDVKGTQHPMERPSLIINKDNSKAPDVFALVQLLTGERHDAERDGGNMRCILHGFLNRQTAMLDKNLKVANVEKGYPPCYINANERLVDFL